MGWIKSFIISGILFLCLVCNFSTLAQKNYLGISINYLNKKVKTEFQSDYSGNTDFKYQIFNSGIFGFDFERNWNEIFISASVNFSSMDLKYTLNTIRGTGNGEQNGGWSNWSKNTEEDFSAKLNVAGVYFNSGYNLFPLDKYSFSFYCFWGLYLEYPIYIQSHTKNRISEKSQVYNPTFSENKITYSDTTFYSNDNVAFRKGIATSIPMGFRCRYSFFKNYIFDFNLGIKPQISSLSARKEFKFLNGVFLGGSLLIPIHKKAFGN